jgi:hypothetical protein
VQRWNVIHMCGVSCKLTSCVALFLIFDEPQMAAVVSVVICVSMITVSGYFWTGTSWTLCNSFRRNFHLSRTVELEIERAARISSSGFRTASSVACSASVGQKVNNSDTDALMIFERFNLTVIYQTINLSLSVLQGVNDTLQSLPCHLNDA